MQMHRYLVTWYSTDQTGSSRPQYVAGQAYPVSEETARHVAQGHAESIDVPEDADAAAKKAERLSAAAAKAVSAAAEAQSLADAAQAAQAAQLAAAQVPGIEVSADAELANPEPAAQADLLP